MPTAPPSVQLWLTAMTFCNAHVELLFTRGHYSCRRIIKASYEKVKTLDASRCQVANDPTKMKSEPGPEQQIASADAIGAGCLRATRKNAREAAMAMSDWQKLLPSRNTVQTALHPAR